MYPPTTDASRILNAIDALRDLRSRATMHYDTLNNWLIIDTLTDVITLLQEPRPACALAPCECQGIRHTCRRFDRALVTIRED